ncbi:polyprenyl synthetase family protein [Streptomyces sp. NPDC087263]|uniref:polyprenyl synthetase family protein n=1 Tax=Streptomyces sp. NPDC087263 TaxID=3365773 RepID=UPI00381F1B96
MMTLFPTSQAQDIPSRVNVELARFMDGKLGDLSMVQASEPVHLIKDSVLAGGKRLQAMWCYWGWRAAGREGCREIIAVGAALELFKWAALVADDIFDRSGTRRGLPTLHPALAGTHREQGWRGDPDHYGLVQTMCLANTAWAWADELMFASGVDPRELATRRLPCDLLRSEVWLGQYFDMKESALRTPSMDRAMNVALLKTARANIMYPLVFGATLAGASAELISAFTDFGHEVGNAFQLHNDLLGVFGDEAVTGKSSLDDFRNGSMTILITWAMEHATPDQLTVFERYHGDLEIDENGTAELRTVIQKTGARDAIEAMADEYRKRAIAILQDMEITAEVRMALTELASVGPVL